MNTKANKVHNHDAHHKISTWSHNHVNILVRKPKSNNIHLRQVQTLVCHSICCRCSTEGTLTERLRGRCNIVAGAMDTPCNENTIQ